MPGKRMTTGRRTNRFVLVAATTVLVASAAGARLARAGDPAPAPAPEPAASAVPAATPAPAAAPDPNLPANDAERSLWAAEEGFAASFAARDPERFASYLADDTIFIGRRRLNGKQEVREVWAKMMTSGPQAPFSWRPSRAIVAGDVGMTSGAVLDPEGKWSGAFTSVWRRQPDGSWKVVLDGAAPCETTPR